MDRRPSIDPHEPFKSHVEGEKEEFSLKSRGYNASTGYRFAHPEKEGFVNINKEDNIVNEQIDSESFFYYSHHNPKFHYKILTGKVFVALVFIAVLGLLLFLVK
jgi:hypothetical protein